ncbi:MAG: hypothetical protein JNM65_08600 [Verrucomicrobiaceae bacterium]|nr:hypothetical protein [Verrucomicrobiaceae bacterium]
MLPCRLRAVQAEEVGFAIGNDGAGEPRGIIEVLVRCDAIGGSAFIRNGWHGHGMAVHGAPLQVAIG